MIMKKKNIEKILDRIAYLEIAVNAFRDRLKHLEDYGTKELSIEINSEAETLSPIELMFNKEYPEGKIKIKKTKIKEYKYGDKVEFVSGFYKGSKGVVTKMNTQVIGYNNIDGEGTMAPIIIGQSYDVILTDGHEIEKIEPNEIKLRKK